MPTITQELVQEPAGELAGELTEERRALPGFLTGFMAIHDAMRRDARRLVACSERQDRAVAATTGEQLLDWWRRVETAIVHHHQAEDEVVWPDLVARRPAFGERRPELEVDHHALDDAMAAVRLALVAAAGGADDVPARRRAVSRFATLLDQHLAREEAAAFPLLAEAYTAAEYAVIEKRLAQGSSLGRLAFELPWVLDGTGAALDDLVAELLPAPVRLLNRVVFTRRYRRIAAPMLEVAR